MLPFPVEIRPGDAPVHQVVRAATRAILSGILREGDRFPSVRDLAEALKLHPNTAQKVIAQLQQDGLLIAQPGVGTVVQAPPTAKRPDPRRTAALEAQLDKLVIEARQAGLDEAGLSAMLATQWRAAFGVVKPPAEAPPARPDEDETPHALPRDFE